MVTKSIVNIANISYKITYVQLFSVQHNIRAHLSTTLGTH